jgi:autotransporter translocation and assembly factor TamB
LKLTLAAKDGRASVDGRATAPDFPAAEMTASMPFRPAEWADDSELIRKEPLSARVDLPRLDLARFGSLVPAARKLSGILTGNVQVAGALGQPVVKGRLDLTAGGFEFADGNQPAITGAAASLDLTQDRITLANLQAMIAGGSLRGGGSLTLENGRPGIADFRITANHLPLLRNDSLIVRADADFRLTGPWERAALSGNVGIVDSLFYRDIELLPIGSPFTAPSAAALPKIDPPRNPAAAVPEPFRNWSVNVLVRTKNPFLIRGNVATGKVEANLRLGGTLANPVPDGTVEVSDLKAELPFSTLAVRRGTLRFNAGTGFDPILEIRGNAEPRPYRVSVFVYGRASDPQLVLTSSPPLPENEIMTLLATGTTTTGLEDPQAASSRAMQLLAEELRRGRFAVGKQLRPLLGLLDRVDFSLAEADPYSSESFSTATVSITDRWFLSAGMGGEGDSRVLAIWRLTFH